MVSILEYGYTLLGDALLHDPIIVGYVFHGIGKYQCGII